ncbi:DUF1295 domain-containing protein [bacterium]|nr:DUF1295 domain-containing protein [bacterium]
MGLNVQLMLEAVPLLFLIAVGAWLISQVLEDVSVAYYVWSLMLLVTAATYAYHSGLQISLARSDQSNVGLALLIMVAIWSLRLSAFLIIRGRNRPEDRRYQAIREKFSPNFGLKSLALIFIFQAFLVWIISSLFALVFATGAAISWSICHSVGVALWLVGMIFETLADNQLHRFNKLVVRDSQTLSSGLWRYSRHPNYFGECCIWWGWAVFAIPSALAIASPWVIVAPLLMTILLLKVSGVSHMERGITDRRHDYRHYAEATSVVVPWKPRQKVLEDL